jgi:hypothetical protein
MEDKHVIPIPPEVPAHRQTAGRFIEIPKNAFSPFSAPFSRSAQAHLRRANSKAPALQKIAQHPFFFSFHYSY